MRVMWWDVWKKKSVLRRQPAMNVTASTHQPPGPEPSIPSPRVRPLQDMAHASGAQPNELDRKRISRVLLTRKRYRYVSPSVRAVENGYLVESPCCSRRIDPDGGVVDVALLQYSPGGPQPWSLYRKAHERDAWELHSKFEQLHALLGVLNEDPLRLFWQ